ncbi:hypothetical protein Tco_1444899 [Tanacetum coccineum]
MQGPLGRKTIPTSYFFNRDLEYLMHWSKEKKYVVSLSKYHDVKYEQKGIEEAIPYLWSSSIVEYDRDTALAKRADGKEYVFKEADYLKLSVNDIEDMYLLKV